MLEPVDKHFGTKDKEEGTHDLARPIGKHSKAMRKERAARSSGPRSRATRKATRFDNVARGDDDEHEPELESLDDIGARHLEEILFFDFLEDGGFDLDELVGHEKGQESVGVRVDGHVQGYDLVEERRCVDDVVTQSQKEEPQWS